MNMPALSALLANSAGRVMLLGDAAAYPILLVENSHARARIALHGAQVLSFQVHGEQDLLWTSESAVYREGAAIRGGIPICWPWFGPSLQMPPLQAHGFARNHFWSLASVLEQSDGSSVLNFSLTDTAQTRQLWPHGFILSLAVVVGRNLSVSLTMTNTDSLPVQITAALHTYLRVSEISRIAIRGLENTRYIDTLAANAVLSSPEAITFAAETDRIYFDCEDEVVIDDPLWPRKIKVAKTGSRTTVVWNPWVEKSSKMADFDRGGYQNMVCVEATNAADDSIALAPGESHCLATTVSSIS